MLSTIARQMIEQICVIKEIEHSNINDAIIVEAMIESHNKHVGANKLDIDGLNSDNKGILKIFNYKTNYGSLAKKYGYSFIYNFFSGDIHHISTIEKSIPNVISKNDIYNKNYLLVYISLINDAITIVDKYCKHLSVEDKNKLSKINFIKLN